MGIRYEGRYPDADSALGTKKWSDDTAAAVAVTPTFITSEIARVVTANNLQTATYVDAQDALLAKLADVQTAATALLPDTARNTTVAGLDASGMVFSSQIAGAVTTDRVTRSFAGSAVFSGSYTATTTTPREKKLATVTITDPGFAYIPLPFGFVTGSAGGTPSIYPWTGNGVCGQLVVCPPQGSGDTIYGLGGCTDSTVPTLYPILPYGASQVTPTNRPAVTGNLTLDLYGCCFQGGGYTFYSTNLAFYVIVIPAM
jgi:hypothetical protein